MSEPSIKGHYALKSGEGFALLNERGLIPARDSSPCGIVWRNMRHVSKCEPCIGGQELIFLRAEEDHDNELRFFYANAPFTDRAGRSIPERSLEIARHVTMANGRVHEKFSIRNKSRQRIDATLAYHVEAGFEDIFDIRSEKFLATPVQDRVKRGRADPPEITARIYKQHYTWKDNKGENDAEWRFSQPPDEKSSGTLTFYVSANPGDRQEIYSSFGPAGADHTDENRDSYNRALRRARRESRKLSKYGPAIISSNDIFNRALDQSFHDLSMLISELETGPYPFAGLPWFCTPFGRDAGITALLTLPFYPNLARGVLRFQAQNQAKDHNLFRQAEKGKIFHEMRPGSESATLGENPFESYYGGVDTTPLFVVLAGKYFDRTDDRKVIQDIWPEIRDALQWVTNNMDRNGGYVRYFYDKDGLTQQGWKDSADSVFHADAPGVLPPDPIALCEVQAYAYGALRAGARFADMFGDPETAKDWSARADDLYRRYNADFWLPAMNTYALALDGKNKPCAISTSNAGYGFLTGIVPDDRALLLAKTLMDSKNFSGFGVRTLAKGPGYSEDYSENPRPYHRGTVWPHDTAMIAVGMAEYGLKEEVMRILTGLIAATEDDPCLPELFSGAARTAGRAKAPYPSACAPQAWAAASLHGVLGACIRPVFDLAAKTVDISRAALPPEAGSIRIIKWPVGGKHLDIDISP